MLRLLLPLGLLLIGLGGGVGAGLMLAGGGEDAAQEETSAEHDTTGDTDGADTQTIEPRSVEQSGGGTEYVRLNNQFVVPIIRNGSVSSLVVMGLTLEVDTGQSSTVFNQEPRLRDSFLRVMFAHANVGGFDGAFTESAALEPLREALREAASGTADIGTVHDVLITDITRQDA